MLTDRFAPVSGGLFTQVTKADVGEATGELMAAGYDILAWADPFFPDRSLPDPVREAMAAHLVSGMPEHYTMPIGSVELRTEIARKLARDNGLPGVDPRRNVLVTPGSDAGLMFAMMPFLDPGDEVLVPDPSYPSNAGNARLLGAVPVAVPLHAADGYQPDVAEFAARLTPRTRMVLLTHPNNPTGTVLRRDRLEELCRWIVEQDLVLVCDQAFEDHVFDGVEMVTPAALPGMWQRTVTAFSVSKGLGLSGLRVGWLVADDVVMDRFYGAAVNVVGATSTLSQVGALAALREPGVLARNFSVLERRRRVAYDLLSDVPGVRMARPESGFLSWLDVSALGTAADVVEHVKDHARVVVNEGTAYGAQGAGHVRVVHGCFADEDRLVAALQRVRAALVALAGRPREHGSPGPTRRVRSGDQRSAQPS